MISSVFNVRSAVIAIILFSGDNPLVHSSETIHNLLLKKSQRSSEQNRFHAPLELTDIELAWSDEQDWTKVNKAQERRLPYYWSYKGEYNIHRWPEKVPYGLPFFSFSPAPSKPPMRRSPHPAKKPTPNPSKPPKPTLGPTEKQVMSFKPTPRPVRTTNPTGQPIRMTPKPTRRPFTTTRPTMRMIATPRPTAKPVTRRPRPTRRPRTTRPTSSPTSQPPQMLMRPSPTPSRQPAAISPSADLVCNPPITALQRESQLFDIVSNVSLPMSLLNPETPQFNAFFWLTRVDEAQVCPEDELNVIQRYVLALLYYSTRGGGWKECNAEISIYPAPCAFVRWLDSGDVCSWFGVSCDQGGIGEIQSIRMQENNLNGNLPRELSALSQLARLDFMGNIFISSTIPASFETLDSLVQLTLQDNSIEGKIPDELFDAEVLGIIDLSENDIGGSIPASIVKMEQLDVFEVDDNRVAGSLPPDLPDSLRFFIANNNNISGPIPPNLDDNTNLRVIAVGSNRINGTIPEFVGSLSNLQTLNFFDNEMFGTIPASLGGLSNLENLFLHFNVFTGTVPASICALNLDQLTADCGPRGTVVCTCCTLCF